MGLELTATERRLASLEARVQRQRRLLIALVGVAAAVLAGETLFWHNAPLHASPAASHPERPEDSILRVRGLIVVDSNGVERVWIGAPLPAPLLGGKRLSRLGDISGILLMDEDGNERSGYFTSNGSDEVALTLDNVSGQAALFFANPTTGAHLTLWDPGKAVARLSAHGQPGLTLTHKGVPVTALPDTATRARR